MQMTIASKILARQWNLWAVFLLASGFGLVEEAI